MSIYLLIIFSKKNWREIGEKRKINGLNANISNDIDTFKDVRLNSYEVGAGYVLNKTAQLVLGYRQQNMSLYSNANSRQEYNYMGGLIGGFNINF
jgi:hypothetical protein